MNTMRIVDTKRLSFRLLDSYDEQLLFELDQEPEVMKFINGGKPNSMQIIQDILMPRMLAYRNEQKGWGIWKVSEISSKVYLGWLMVRPMHFFSDSTEFDNLEIGWRFFKSQWGNGYGTEAAKQLVKAYKDAPDVEKISAIAQEKNYASVAIMKKIGMSYVKTYYHIDPLYQEEVVHYQLEL